MYRARSDLYRSWLVGELVLVVLLAFATALLAFTGRLDGYELPAGRVALDAGVAVLAAIVASLAAIRFRVEGRAMDLALSLGFGITAAGTLAFGIVPVLDGVESTRAAWTLLGCQLASGVCIALSPFLSRRIGARDATLCVSSVLGLAVLGATWGLVHGVVLDRVPPSSTVDGNASLSITYGVIGMLSLVAATGFGLRYRRHGRDLDSWLALALTLVLFASLHYVLVPTASSRLLLQGDVLRLLAYGVLLVGVWRAISHAEFGRAVAEERARVAGDIHDGLAQYLFAISTSVSMLEAGASLDGLLPRLKEASVSAQQEARFAVLALSSASGRAPFDAALRRYVDFLVADGVLDVELDIDPGVSLAPDEQIEVFRIVQEGLANARKHASARRAWVEIAQAGGRRVLSVRDDGVGFDEAESTGGQGLVSMERRAASIDGGISVRSGPGEGTEIEVVLRAA